MTIGETSCVVACMIVNHKSDRVKGTIQNFCMLEANKDLNAKCYGNQDIVDHVQQFSC